MGLELEAIAAVVIGGTSLAGGRGSVISSALGAMVMAVLGAGLAQMGVQEPTRRLVDRRGDRRGRRRRQSAAPWIARGDV